MYDSVRLHRHHTAVSDFLFTGRELYGRGHLPVARVENAEYTVNQSTCIGAPTIIVFPQPKAP